MRANVKAESGLLAEEGRVAFYTRTPSHRAMVYGNVDHSADAPRLEISTAIVVTGSRYQVLSGHLELMEEGIVNETTMATTIEQAGQAYEYGQIMSVIAFPRSRYIPSFRLEKEMRQLLPDVAVVHSHRGLKKELAPQVLTPLNDFVERLERLLDDSSDSEAESDSLLSGHVESSEGSDAISLAAGGDIAIEHALRTLFPTTREVLAVAATTSDLQLSMFLLQTVRPGSAAVLDELELREPTEPTMLTQFGRRVGLAAAELCGLTSISAARHEQNIAYLASFGDRIPFVRSESAARARARFRRTRR